MSCWFLFFIFNYMYTVSNTIIFHYLVRVARYIPITQNTSFVPNAQVFIGAFMFHPQSHEVISWRPERLLHAITVILLHGNTAPPAARSHRSPNCGTTFARPRHCTSVARHRRRPRARFRRSPDARHHCPLAARLHRPPAARANREPRACTHQAHR